MTRVSTHLSIALTAGLMALTSPAFAQSTELSAEEIAEAFNKQKTRGLVIVPSTAAVAADTNGAVVQQAAPDQQMAPVQQAAAEAYEPVTEGPEVNIQIAFDLNSAALRSDQAPKLDTLCQVMQSVDVALFQIIGHTDSTGQDAYNKRLSLLRAEEVKRHLVNDCGIADTRLKAIGMGETAPLNTDNTRADENRRVEFQALG